MTDPKELKIQALTESFSQKVGVYENHIADIRVVITQLTEENEQLRKQLAELKDAVTEPKPADKKSD